MHVIVYVGCFNTGNTGIWVAGTLTSAAHASGLLGQKCIAWASNSLVSKWCPSAHPVHACSCLCLGSGRPLGLQGTHSWIAATSPAEQPSPPSTRQRQQWIIHTCASACMHTHVSLH